MKGEDFGAGKESTNVRDEAPEFVYILSGRGIAEIGDETLEVGPGDAMLFTAPSVSHHLRNPLEVDERRLSRFVHVAARHPSLWQPLRPGETSAGYAITERGR